MKKICVFLAVFIVLLLSGAKVSAEEVTYDMSGVYNSLSDETKEHLLGIGADSPDALSLSGLSFENLGGELLSIANDNCVQPFRGLLSVIAILLICSLLYSYKSTLISGVGDTLDICASLCICCAAAVPAASLIADSADVIALASNLMLSYAPLIVVLMLSSGQTVSSGAYYATLMGAGELIMQLSSRLLTPFLQMLLGLSVAGGVSPQINLRGLVETLVKISKWVLGFSMGLYSAFLGIRQTASSALDNVTGRALRFSLTSFIPVVGSSLSEAYQTVRNSLNLLKSGIGVFVILSLGFTFLPLLFRCLMWLAALKVGDAAAQALGLPSAALLLRGIACVLSLLNALLLCVMCIYIISTAAVLMFGGAS